MTIKIYTDGSCLGNPGRGGWGFVIVKNEQCVYKESGAKDMTTNNIMELTAIEKALRYMETVDYESFSVYTDSNYAKQGITSWSKKWRINNWKSSTGSQIKNVEIWKSIVKTETKLKEDGKEIQWNWVKAHSTDEFNNIVDELAREQANSVVLAT
jgi:ribonuclease HI